MFSFLCTWLRTPYHARPQTGQGDEVVILLMHAYDHHHTDDVDDDLGLDEFMNRLISCIVVVTG